MPHKDPEARRVWCRAWYARNKQARLDAHKAWRDANKEHCAAYRKDLRGPRNAAHRRDRYGLTPDAFNALWLAQGGKCAICEDAPEGNGAMGVLHVDHCHATGKVRALLCQRCNKALGGFRDSPALLAKAKLYLEFHAQARNTA